MTKSELLRMARAAGFTASVISAGDVPVDPKFRTYCEENLCGQYGANHACPPDCGTVEELHRKLLAEEQVLVLNTVWDVAGYDDIAAVRTARETHNNALLRLAGQIREAGYAALCAGYNGCPLCSPCKRKENLPCPHPELRITCLSAYCVDVAKLAERCGMEFAWTPDKLYLYGMITFHKAQ